MNTRFSGLMLLELCACLMAAQVLIRPAIGQANNGDFPKMAGPFGLGPEEGDWASHEQYSDFVYKYVRADRYLYSTLFRSAEFLSSEYFFVKLARGIQRIVRPGPRFDIRWLGAVHVFFFLVAIGIWIQALPPAWKLFTGLFAIFVWTDAAYVQYMNTFYMDTAAIIFLVMCTAAALHAVGKPHRGIAALLTVAAGILFAVSKTQHAIPALLFVPFFLILAWRPQSKLSRAVWIAGAILLPAGSYLVLSRASTSRGVPLFSFIFMRLAPESPDPLRTLQEVGLGQDEMKFLGQNAYYPDVPFADPNWVHQFNARCNYASVGRYFLHHPGVPVHILWSGLAHEAAVIRPIANLSPEDGFKPYSSTKHFVWWTDFRSFLLRKAPWHMVLLEIVVLLSAAWMMRSPETRALGLIALVIQFVALSEYAESLLTEAVETTRHLILFHLATDLMILLLPILISQGRFSRLRPAKLQGSVLSSADERP